jgi:hypothetical protein
VPRLLCKNYYPESHSPFASRIRQSGSFFWLVGELIGRQEIDEEWKPGLGCRMSGAPEAGSGSPAKIRQLPHTATIGITC